MLAVAAIAAAFIGMPAANAQQIDCATLTMQEADVPDGIVPYRHGTVADTWSFATPSDPIQGARIYPNVDMLACGFDYSASLTAGLLELDFNHAGAYYVEITHLSGLQTRGVVCIDLNFMVTPGNPPPASGRTKTGRYTPQTPDILFYAPNDVATAGAQDADIFDSVPRHPGVGPMDFQSKICAAHAANGGNPVDVTIFAHNYNGREGTVNLTNSDHPADSIRLSNVNNWFCDVEDKIGTLELNVCRSGEGDAGAAFACAVADKINGKVVAPKGCVYHQYHFFWGDRFRVDGGFLVKDGNIANVDPEPVDRIAGFPLLFSEPDVDPILETMQAGGEPETTWDVDASGGVDDFDLLLVSLQANG